MATRTEVLEGDRPNCLKALAIFEWKMRKTKRDEETKKKKEDLHYDLETRDRQVRCGCCESSVWKF
jgi:hypothetical protein